MKKVLALVLISSSSLLLASSAIAASTEAKATYADANKMAGTNYKEAKAKCDGMTDTPKSICIAEAKAARTTMEANAKAEYKNTVKARTDARVDIAKANYDVSKAKCDALVDNAKDVCVKEAKAALVTAKGNAKADKKVSDARTDAHDDKVKAEYKVELEKCEALTAEAKNTCVAAVKTKYHM